MEKELTNPLEQEYFFNVCKMGQGNDCCRYLVSGSNGIECAKNSSLKGTLDKRANGGSMIARGNNCDGVLNPKF